jgi:hypothetical protein
MNRDEFEIIDYQQAKVNMIKVFGDFPNPPQINNLENDYRNAKEFHNEAIQNINVWRSLYEAKNINRGKNRSKTRPKEIKKMYRWSYPSIEEPILSKKDIVILEPRTYEDRLASQINQIILNQQIQNDIDFNAFVNKSTRSLVIDGTLIVKIAWNRKYEKIKKIVPIYKEQTVQDPQTGAFITQQVKVGTEIKVVEEMTENNPVPEVCDIKKIIIDPTAKGDIDKANFIIHEYETNLSNLHKKGIYKNLELIKTNNNRSTIDEENDINNFNFEDKARKRLWVKEYWGYWDIDGDGKTEMIVVTYIDDIIIGLEVNPLPFNKLPFEICHYEPIQDSNYGEPDAEVIGENQENIGAVTRAMIDIIARSASGQEALPEGWLSPQNQRKYENGENYKYNPMIHPKEAVYMHTPPEIPNSIFNFIQHQHNEVHEMVGKKPFSIGKIGSSTSATAIRGSLDATAKRELGVLRRYKKMLEKVFGKMIELNRIFLTDKQMFRISNDKYLVVNREKMFGRFDIKIEVTTPEDVENKINKKSFLLQTLGNTIPFEITKEMMADIAKLEEDPQAEKRLREYQPQPDPIAQQKAQLELSLLQWQIEMYKSSVAENSTDAQVNTAKVEELKAKTQKIMSEVDKIDLDFLHKVDGVDHMRQLEQGQQKINRDIDMELLKDYMVSSKENNKGS